MSEIMVYITRKDADFIREWLNEEQCVAWIVKEVQAEHIYRWKAVDRISEMLPQEYCLWHKTSAPLCVPSGETTVPDAQVLNPYAGWSQRLDALNATVPWFGSDLPGPYNFRFSERGKEAFDSIPRSGFTWHGDHFRAIGKEAPPQAKSWWKRLKRFVEANSTALPWPDETTPRRRVAYAFADAYLQHRRGRRVDVNP